MANDPSTLTLAFTDKGMNSALNADFLPKDQYSRATNVQIINQRPSTRRGVRVVELTGDDVDKFKDNNFQGAIFYNPSKGQSQQRFSRDDSRIVAVVGGERLEIFPDTKQATNNSAVVTKITGVPDSNPNLHQAWLYQAENYVIHQDGEADAWIWDGSSSAFNSNGVDLNSPLQSQIPNGGGVGVYAHGRIAQVVDSRNIIVGDIIHKTNLSDSINILDTSEQIYWATGSSFNPPSSMGNIRAISILPLQDTQHGHGDLMVHCEDGVFSLNINLFPRSKWADTPIVKHVLLETGAMGAFAIALYDGDQFFRSRHGLQSIRSARANTQLQGNPLYPISEEVKTWVDSDYEAFVRFTSVSKWSTARRLFMTVAPWVQGKRRGSRGIVSLNFAPVDSVRTGRAWEGLMTFPPEIQSPIQIVNGLFNGRDRSYMIASGNDGKNRLVEFSSDLANDVLEDGTESRISCQIITGMVSGVDIFENKEFTHGVLMLAGVKGELDWGIWARESDCENWTKWRSGKACVKAEDCNDECSLNDYCEQDIKLNLGSLPKKFRFARRVQFLIRWRGVASIEALKVYHTIGDPDENSLKVAGSDKCDEVCLAEQKDCQYDDYEYREDFRWENEGTILDECKR